MQDIDPFSSINNLINHGVPETEVILDAELPFGDLKLKEAPNAIVFIESPDYFGSSKLYPVQFDVVRDFFELLCPVCNDIERIHQRNDIPRENQILFQYNKCPICGLDKYFVPDEYKYYNEIIGIVGMRSGKTILLSDIAGYIVHKYLVITNLQEVLGIVKNQQLDGSFIAVSSEQASETVWGAFRNQFNNSRWFQQLKKNLKKLEKDHGLKSGSLYDESDKSIDFNFKNIKLKSLHSNSGSLAGRTRLFAIIDEISRFDTSDSKRSGLEVYRVFKHSLLTLKAGFSKRRKEGIFDGIDAYMLCMSSPIHLEDQGMKLLKQSQSQEKMLAFKMSTWEANPTISMDDVVEEFEIDPVGAERDYGANPPGAENPFIKDPKLVEICISKEKNNIFKFKERSFQKEANKTIFNYVTVDIIDLIGWNNLFEYYIHIDPGRKNDSFALGMGHLELIHNKEIVIIDGALEIKGLPKANRYKLPPKEVYFPAMLEILLYLNRKLVIKAISYDSWNSAESIDRLRDVGILTIGENINRDDHVRFLRSITDNTILFPKPEVESFNKGMRNVPCAKAIHELLRLTDNGKKVDHLVGESNDIIQTYVGVHRLLTNQEKLLSKYVKTNPQYSSALSKLNRRNPQGKKKASNAKIIRFRR